MTLIDVLLHEQVRDIFTAAVRERAGLNAAFPERAPADVDDGFDGRGALVRIDTTVGGSLLVTARGVFREVGSAATLLAPFGELVGYDWISPDMETKIAEKRAHFDRLYVYLRGERTVVLDHLGQAVYPLMALLGKVLAIRSEKLLLRRMDDGVAELVGRCLRAAAEGPFFADDELEELFGLDRASLAILAGTWSRMNLASPDLRRTIVSVIEMLLARRGEHASAWDERVGERPEVVVAGLEVFRRVVAGEV